MLLTDFDALTFELLQSAARLRQWRTRHGSNVWPLARRATHLTSAYT